jgi:hypothetical protein
MNSVPLMQTKKFRAKIDYLFPLVVLLFSTLNVWQHRENPNIPSLILSLVGITGVILFFRGIKYFSICLYLWILLQVISIPREFYDPSSQLWHPQDAIFDLTQGFRIGFGYYWINDNLKTGIYINFLAVAFFAFLRILEVSAMAGRQLHFRPFHRDSDFAGQFPVEGIVKERIVVSGEKNWLLVDLNTPMEYEGAAVNAVLIKSKDGTVIRGRGKEQLVHFRLVLNNADINTENLNSSTFPFLDWVWCY